MNILSVLKLYIAPLCWGHLMVLAEALLGLAIPYLIGNAVNDAVAQSFSGSLVLLIVSVLLALTGAFRRSFNIRLYGRIFKRLAVKQVDNWPQAETSKVSAHFNLFQEFVDIMREDIPSLFYQLINIIGTLIILVSMSWLTTFSAVVCGLAILLVYYLYRNRIKFYNQQYNAEYESQVEAINHPYRRGKVRLHLHKFIHWKIKLTDMDTLTYTIGWIILDFFMVMAIWHIVGSGEIKEGMIVTLVMYLYQLTSAFAELPFFYVRFIRLREIARQTK